MIFWKYSHWYAVALRASIFILLVCSAPLISFAQFNPEINYQAKLTDSAGVAVTSGDYDIVFRLYTASSTGTAIWTESRTGADQVNVQNGLFSVMLGDVSSLAGVDFNQTLYLGVTVGADSEMTPRKVLGTVPAAFIAEVANNANQVGGVASSSFLRSDQADTMVASTTSSLLTINQQGAGNILDLLDNGTSVLTVADGGNVGVGISNPNQRLTVHGNINIVDSNSGYMIDNNRVLYASSTNQSTLVGAGAGSSLLSGGLRNTAVGFEALNVVTDASNNTAIGYQALAANTTGSGNVAAGVSALSANTTGFNNAANGYLALTANTTGTYNVAMGFRALTANTIGDSNTAIGRDALLQNTIGNNNVALGRDSLAANTTGSENIGVGFRALNSNTTARRNVAVGVSALNNNMTGDNNVALGYLVMRQNVSGVNNIALGTNALYENITGNGNIAMGDQAGRFLSNGTSFASTTDNSIFIGGATRAVTDNDQNSIVIGYQAQGLGSNTVVIGNDSISATALKGNVGIGTTTPSSKLTVAGDVSLTGDLKIGATTAIDSSQRFFASDGALAIGGLSYSFTNDSNTGFYNSAPNEMRFVTNTTDRMTIMANGNVGIGTTTPSVDGGSARLTLQSAGNNGALQLYSPDVTTRSIFNVYGPASTDTESGKAFGFVAIGDANASGMFYTDGKYGIGNGSGSRDTFISRHSTSMLKISSDGSSGIADLFVTGDIGIGTAAPSSRLTVAGDAYITGALRDSTNSAGTTGYILQTTGSGTEWVATSSLGVGASFSTSAELADLISDETGSGPLVFANSATMNSLTLSGAGQQFLNIDFDTNNNQTGMDGYIRFRNDGSAIAVASMGYSESIDALVLSHSSTLSPYHFVVNNQGNVGIGIATPSSRLAVAGDIDIVNPASGLSLNGVRMFYASTTNRSVLIGNEAGSNLNDGSFRNIAIGELALSVATSSDNNVAIGAEALRYSTSGRFNTAIGSLTLENNTTGQYNMALGGQALRSVTTGSNNVAIGFASLANVDSDFNIAIGRQAGGGLLTGTENIFIGSFTGLSATSTSNNTYIGRDAARFNTNTTGQNVTLGHRAGRGDAGGADYTGSVIIGYLAGNNMTTASNNILLGWRTGDSLTSGTNNIVIGYDVEAPSNTASNQLNIGNLIFGTGVDGTGTTLSSGNVGIGVTNPTNKLEVDGTILSRNMTVFNDDAGVAPFVVISGAGDSFNYSGFGLGNTNNARQWSWLYRSGNTVAAETDQLFLQYYDGDVGYYDPLAISSTTVTMNNAYITGALRDSSNAAGTNGMVLQTTGAGTEWVATSSLGLGGATDFLSLTDTPGSYTANRLLFTNSGGDSLTDSANLTFDGTNLNLGGNQGLAFNGVRMFTASTTLNNISIGENAGESYIGGIGNANDFNVTLGYEAGRFSSTTSSFNNRFSNIIGYQAGFNNSGTVDNIMGYQAGYNNTGYFNNLFGPNTGFNNSGGDNNMFGDGTGYNNTGNYNNLIGAYSGYENTGNNNNFLGEYVGYNNTGSSNNILGNFTGRFNAGSNNNILGNLSGYSNSGSYSEFIGFETAGRMSASSTVAIGQSALRGGSGSVFLGNAATTTNNTALGAFAGYSAQTGADNNLLLGYRSGYSLTTGANNIIIGYDVEAPSNTASNQLNIGNLIFGTGIDGTGTTTSSGNIGIGITTPQSKLDVWGDFRVGTGTVSTLFANAANGRVGIGTISPNFNLSLSGNSNQTIGMNRSTAGAGNDLTIEAGGAQSGVDSVGGDLILSSGRAYDSNDNGDLSSIDFKTTGRLLDDGEIELIGSSADVLPTTKMTILGNGRVGIGTETPTSMLSVRATGAGDVLDLIATTSASLLRVTSLGDIGIGTTTPSAKLTVAGDSITTGRILAGATVDLDGVVNLTGAAGMTTDGIIAIEDTFSDFSFDRVSAIGSIMDINPDANYAAGATDGYSSVVQTRAGNGFNLGEITGSTISVGHLGSGTITDTIGQFVEVLNLGGGTLTNTYGLYVGDVTDGSQTNTAYSIYAQDSNAWNYFAGNTGIGTTTPGSRLAVVNTTTSLSNTALGQFSLQVNPATNGSSLYSGIMNTLKTPSGTTSNIGSLEGVTNIVTHAGTGAVANGIIGTANKVTVSGNSTNGSVLGSSNSLQINDGTHTSVYGHSNNAQFNGGTVTNYIGVSDSVGVFGGDIENYYGGYFITPFIISGAIENTYGVYIQDVASAATTNGWNLYVEGASSQNYIAGNLGIGDTNPTTKLSVSGGGVKFSTLSAAASGNITVCINNTTKVLFQGASATTCTPSSIEYKNTVASTSNMMAIVRELDTVTFFFNEGDEEQQIGFIAEDVSKVDSRLVQFDANGKPGALKLDNFIGLLTASVRETDMSLTELFTTGVPSATSTFAHIFEQNEDTIWSRMVTLVSGFVDGVLTIAGVRTSEICLTDGGGETCIDRSALENLINGSNSTQPTAPEPSYVPPKAPNEPIVDDTAASTSEDIPPDITATTTEESTATSTTEETSVNRTTETSDDANSTEAAPPDIQTIGASEIASSTDTTDSE